MGYWNESCMLTGLPIQSGEYCKCVLLWHESPHVARTTYPSDEWSPVSPLFDCIYDGYGSIEATEDPDSLDNKILKHLFETNDFYSGDVPRSNFRTIQQADLKSDNLPLSMDKLLNIAQDNHHPIWLHAGRIPSFSRRLSYAFIRADMLNEALKLESAVIYRTAYRNCDSIYDLGSFALRNSILLRYQKPDWDLSELYGLEGALQTLRKTWHPCSGCGSQRNIEDRNVVNFYKAVAEFAEREFLEYEYQFGQND